jgi:hypothetical protein
MWELPYREIAQELTNRNIPTPRGGDSWNAMSVMRAMKRLGFAAARDEAAGVRSQVKEVQSQSKRQP